MNTKRTIEDPLWFSGICDDVLSRLVMWDLGYNLEKGYIVPLPIYGKFQVRVELIATRKCMAIGVKEGYVDKPTAYCHWIPWRKLELDYLYKIVKALKPDPGLVEIVEGMIETWKNKPGTLLRGGYRILELPFYQGIVRILANLMKDAKSGRRLTSVDPVLQRKEQGKDLFET